MPAVQEPNEEKDFETVSRKLQRDPDGVYYYDDLAVMRRQRFESIRETIEVLSDEKLMRDIRDGLRDMKEGKGRSWDEAMEELGW